jgi:membrane protein implicated in regulation of membrane protease activity
MAWWSWVILGAVLLGIELFAVDAQFFLIFLGAGAVVVGLVGLLGIDLPTWMQWLLFAALSIAAMLTIRKQLYTALHSRATGKVDTDTYQLVRIPAELAPGKTTRVEYRGTGWTALNVGERLIPAGEEVRIEAVEGLTLRVRLH